jgi:hypothetical protein
LTKQEPRGILKSSKRGTHRKEYKMTTYELNEMAKAGATIAELLEAAEVDMTEWEEDE